MIRTINLGGQPVEVNSSMGWLFVYKRTFGHDILPDIMPLLEAVISGLGEITGAMAEDADGNRALTAKDAQELMNSDAIVEMFIKLAGMELTTLLNILWALAKNQNPNIKDPEAYINSFDRMPLDELAPALFYILLDSAISEKSKNVRGLLPKVEKMIPSVLTSSPSQESTEG